MSYFTNPAISLRAGIESQTIVDGHRDFQNINITDGVEYFVLLYNLEVLHHLPQLKITSY